MENKQLLDEGIAYLAKLHKVDPEKPKLGAEVTLNFVSIGIESVLTAVLMGYDKLVDHSGILMLLRELEKVEPVNQTWIDTARMMNKFQSYCTLEKVEIKIPTTEELKKIVAFGLSVEEYAKGIKMN